MKIGQRIIGEGRTFVIAEAGINHDGSLERALALINAAADAGADAVKFQTFRADELGAPQLAPYVLEPGAWPILALHAASRGLIFFSTPFDCESVDLLDPLVSCFKVASGEIINERLLRHVASKGKPVVLSTGMADEREIVCALMWLGDGTAWSWRDVALLHCVSAYPAFAHDMNLRAISFLAERFGGMVGLSDHSLGDEIAIAAVAMGACMIEKHVTLNRGATGPDHHMSIEPQEFAVMVQRIRNVEAAMGDGVKRCMPSEQTTLAKVRRDPVTGKRP